MNKIEERFWSKVNVTTGCWLWTGAKTYRGQGQFFINGKTRLATHVCWEFYYSPVKNGLLLCHKCDIPQCVNTDHLFVGTQSDNMLDCSRKGRLKNQNIGKKICIRGHELSGDNLIKNYINKNCKKCKNILNKMSRDRLKALDGRGE